MDKNIFCFVEETPTYKYRFFSRILLVNTFHKNATCVILCSEDTKKIIEEFPITYCIKLVFIPNIFDTYNLVYTFANILKVLWYAVTNYGHGIYLYDNLMMVHKMVIPENIKKQGYGFHKKIFNSHDKENNKKRYSFEVIYASNKEFVKTVEDILGGVRSAATYIGARRLKDMPKCATFVRVNNNINRVYERYTIG